MSNSENLNISAMSDLVEEVSEQSEKTKEKSSREKAKLVIQSLSAQGKWHLLQEYLMDIQADGKLKQSQGQKFPTYAEQQILLHKRIASEFEEDPDTRDLLLGYVSTPKTLSRWSQLPGWNDAIIDKMKRTGLFTAEDRAAAIKAMLDKAKLGDVQAAKIYLTMSGDYTDKVDVSDQKFEKYKEYANTLIGNKTPSDE
jgi:hypothetical protein